MQRQDRSNALFRASLVCGEETVVEELHGVKTVSSALRETLLSMTRIVELHLAQRNVSIEALIATDSQSRVANLKLTLDIEVASGMLTDDDHVH